jgi:hypothetical protein
MAITPASARRRPRLLAAATLLCLLGLLAACGGGDSPPAVAPATGADAPPPPDPYVLDRALVEAAVDLERAGRPLMACLFDPQCEVLAEPENAKRLERALDEAEQAVEIALALAPDACLGEAATAALERFGTLRGVTRARSELDAWDAALRSQEEAVAVSFARAGCSPFSGRSARVDMAATAMVASLEQRLVVRLLRCGDAKCRKREGAALAREAGEAIRTLKPALDGLEDRCAAELGRLSLETLAGYRRLGTGFQRRKDAVVQEAEADLARLGAAGTALYLRCLEDPGLGARGDTA